MCQNEKRVACMYNIGNVGYKNILLKKDDSTWVYVLGSCKTIKYFDYSQISFCYRAFGPWRGIKAFLWRWYSSKVIYGKKFIETSVSLRTELLEMLIRSSCWPSQARLWNGDQFLDWPSSALRSSDLIEEGSIQPDSSSIC